MGQIALLFIGFILYAAFVAVVFFGCCMAASGEDLDDEECGHE